MRDVFRAWPGALRDSNYRADRRTSCARSINFMPAPLAGEDPRSAGGRRRQYFLQPTPGIRTDPRARYPPKWPPRGMVATVSGYTHPGIYIAAGARQEDTGSTPPETEDLGSLYLWRGAFGAPEFIGDFEGELEWREDRTTPPLAQLAWGGPQIGILACVANGKLAFYDERIAASTAGRAATPGTEAAGWFPDVLGQALDSNVIGVQFFQNYFFILDDRNRLFAGPLLGRNTTSAGDLEPLTREMIDHDDNADTPMVPGQIERYKFDLTQLVQRSLEPDPWVAMLALSDRLLLFGRQTGGAWQLKADPGTGFPLEPILGEQFQAGVFSQGSIAAMGEKAYWIGANPQGQVRAYRFGGEAGIEPISTAPVDEYLNTVRQSSREAARCTVTALAGRLCFAMRFDDYRSPSRRRRLDATWCFDETTNMWHERGVWDPAKDGANRGGWLQWEVEFSASYGERPYVIASRRTLKTGRPGTASRRHGIFDGATLTGFLTVSRNEDGDAVDGLLNGLRDQRNNLITTSSQGLIRRERITPPWGEAVARQSIRGVKAAIGRGGGTVELSVSRDSGLTFGNRHGRVPGPDTAELKWGPLGWVLDPVLKITMLGRSAPINNLWANIQRMRN